MEHLHSVLWDAVVSQVARILTKPRCSLKGFKALACMCQQHKSHNFHGMKMLVIITWQASAHSVSRVHLLGQGSGCFTVDPALTATAGMAAM